MISLPRTPAQYRALPYAQRRAYDKLVEYLRPGRIIFPGERPDLLAAARLFGIPIQFSPPITLADLIDDPSLLQSNHRPLITDH